MSLTGSYFSSESAPIPFHHGIRRRGGIIYWAALPSDERRVQASMLGAADRMKPYMKAMYDTASRSVLGLDVSIIRARK
jgi:hypothetical protein